MRRLRHLITLGLLAATFIAPNTGAAAQGVYEDISLVVETPHYVLDDQGLRAPGYALSDAPGAPQLPVWTTVVEVPAGADWSVIELGADEEILQAQGPLPAAPGAQAQLIRPIVGTGPEAMDDALAVANRPDPAIYSADALYPVQVVQAGPEGAARGKRLLPIKVYPFQYNPVTGVIRHRPRIEFAVHFTPPARRASAGADGVGGIQAPAPAGDASEPGLLIQTGERGLYRLTYDALSAAGAPVGSLDPALLTLWYGGEPVAIQVRGGEDGRFDATDDVIFYAEPYAGRYMKQNVYRLTWSGGPAGRMGARPAAPALVQPPVTTIRQRARVENDKQYLSTFKDLPRDADHFFDNTLYPFSGRPTHSVTYTLALENPAPIGDAELQVRVHGGRELADRNPDQSLALRWNGASYGPERWDGSVSHTITYTVPATTLLAGANRLVLEAALSQLPGIDYYFVYPDWAELVYPAKAEAANNRRYVEAVLGTSYRLYLPMLLNSRGGAQSVGREAAAGSDLAIGGFTTPGIHVYDVSDARHPVLLTNVKESGSGGRYGVTFAWKAAASYFAVAESGLLAPAAVQPDAGSSLRSPANAADYLAIVHRSLWDAVQPLLDHRAAEGFRVAKVDIQDVYDEFGGSRVDPEALRAFLAYAYHNWNGGGPRPQYVLLVGDGHFDFKGAVRPDLPILIPPYLLDIDPYIGETAADNRYVSVDDEADFLPDMAVGRIPARTPAEVTAVVDKILAYENSATPGAWQNRAVFVADTKDDPGYQFHLLSDETRTALPATYETQAIYYKASAEVDTAAEVKAAIKSALNSGALYLQWFGHASTTRWGSDRIWELNDPPTLAQNNAWPFTAHYSCWTGYFIGIQASAQYGSNEQSLAEAMLLAPQRGSLVDFSPSGKHVGSALVSLDKALANEIFTQRTDRAGRAVDDAKIAYFGQASNLLDLIDTQLLFGDPATRLKLP